MFLVILKKYAIAFLGRSEKCRFLNWLKTDCATLSGPVFYSMAIYYNLSQVSPLLNKITVTLRPANFSLKTIFGLEKLSRQSLPTVETVVNINPSRTGRQLLSMGSRNLLLCQCSYSCVRLCSPTERLTCPQMTEHPPHLLTGVLRYLCCLLPGLNGHIVLLPAAALQTPRSSTHTCQAMSLAPWVLRHSRAPLLHTWLLNPYKHTHTHT